MTRKLEFTAEDFRKPVGGVQFVGQVECFQEIADMANTRLAEMLKERGVVVWACRGYGHYDTWIEDESELDAEPSHRAVLVNVESLNQEK